LRDILKPLDLTLEDVKDKLILLHDEEGTIWPPMNSKGQLPVTFEERISSYHLLKKKCTNDAVNSGNHTIRINPAVDSVVQIYYASVFNLDTAARDAAIKIASNTNVLIGYLNHDATLAAAAGLVYPSLDNVDKDHFAALSHPLVIPDGLMFWTTINAIAVSEDSNHFIIYNYIGDEPQITYGNPTDAVWSDIS